jgi:hypothetical protein
VRFSESILEEKFLLMLLLWISILGGLLVMMGHHARSEALFYYFRLEDQIPEKPSAAAELTSTSARRFYERFGSMYLFLTSNFRGSEFTRSPRPRSAPTPGKLVPNPLAKA